MKQTTPSESATFESLMRQIIREEVRAALDEVGAHRSLRQPSRVVTSLAKVAPGLTMLTPDEVAAKLSLDTVQTLSTWRSLSKRSTQITSPRVSRFATP